MFNQQQYQQNNINAQQQQDVEPYYQVPRSREPYYEMPKKPSAPPPPPPTHSNSHSHSHHHHHHQQQSHHSSIPLYENVELMFPASSDSSRFSMAESNESFGIDDGTEMVFPIDQMAYLNQMAPKEKPPPLPSNDISCASASATIDEMSNQGQIDNFKRINSTKRIKKEIRNKRSSFLGIEGQDYDDSSLVLSVVPPPNIQTIYQEEKRLEKQLYQKVGLYENSMNGKLLLF
jgi:F-box protein 20